ncbi:MAG: ATP synthase F0 subunit C, partial [Flavobacteriales bacterium]
KGQGAWASPSVDHGLEANGAALTTGDGAERDIDPRAVVIAGVGIGRIGGDAVQAMARQPESINDLRANMILTAALVEGAAFFAMVVGLLVVLKTA